MRIILWRSRMLGAKYSSLTGSPTELARKPGMPARHPSSISSALLFWAAGFCMTASAFGSSDLNRQQNHTRSPICDAIRCLAAPISRRPMRLRSRPGAALQAPDTSNYTG